MGKAAETKLRLKIRLMKLQKRHKTLDEVILFVSPAF